MIDAIEYVKTLSCAAAGNQLSPCNGPIDPAHIRTRAVGAGNDFKDILPLCRFHHSLQHAKGFVYMCDNFPSVKRELIGRGWHVIELFGQRKLKRI